VTSTQKLFFGILLLIVLLGFALLVNQRLYVFPSPETESTFLKNYTPDRVIGQFLCDGCSSEKLSTVSSGAGREFASHERWFEPRLTIRAQDWMPMMTALDDDIASHLARQGAKILNRSGDPRDGFRTQYTVGNTFGDVVVEPLKLVDAASLAARSTLSPGEVTVSLRIAIHEKWFKSRPGLITIEVTNHPK